MPTYRAFLIETGGAAIVRSHNFEAYDESDALERAARYVDGHDVELWEGDKLIKRFQSPAPK
jgi:hypothetical protein